MAKFRFAVQPKTDAGALLGAEIVVDNQTSHSAATTAIRAVLQARADATNAAAADNQAALTAFDA